jgi:UDP-N-acetylglucosamine--N-acetylmuramyl-(pentapeptide) pyrophosphoryl-undecaprenol N-acetylglucosamine transferase
MFRESELTGQKLAEQIRALKTDPARLKQMEKKAGLLGRPEASKELADVCVELMVQAYGPNGRERPAKAEAPKASRSE